MRRFLSTLPLSSRFPGQELKIAKWRDQTNECSLPSTFNWQPHVIKSHSSPAEEVSDTLELNDPSRISSHTCCRRYPTFVHRDLSRFRIIQPQISMLNRKWRAASPNMGLIQETDSSRHNAIAVAILHTPAKSKICMAGWISKLM